MLRIDEIEDAILDTLRADLTLAEYVRIFTPVPSLEVEQLQKLIVQFPAVAVISSRGVYDYALSNVQQETGTFLVLCFNRNLRSATASLRSEAFGEKGLWDLVNDCRAALLPGNIGSGIIECMVTRRDLLFAGEKWAAAALEVECMWRNL